MCIYARILLAWIDHLPKVTSGSYSKRPRG